MDILIVGSGVMGLTCGVTLLEAGHHVHLMAREFPPNTTSNVAAAIWYPYLASPRERVLAWSKVTFEKFYALMEVEAESGVYPTTLLEIFPHMVEDPWWHAAVRSFERIAKVELPPGYMDGYKIEVPLIETPKYTLWLMNYYQSLGGTLEQRTLTNFAELDHPIIINCTGLGSYHLLNDREMFPIRGQVTRVSALPDSTAYIDDSRPGEPVYVIPRRTDTIVGGSARKDIWNLKPSPLTAQIILENASRLVPAIHDAEILEHLVGLRPGRTTVRLEIEKTSPTQTLIHNYGHGGAGFTLSWGCAEEVKALVALVANQTQ